MSLSWLELLTEKLDPTDPSSRDVETIRAAIPFLQFLRDVYFRAEGEGTEHIPTDQNFITVGVHSGGPLLPEVWLTLANWATEIGIDRPAYALIHDIALRVPGLNNLLIKLGALRACTRSAENVLDAGHSLLVYPGGDAEAQRSFWNRNKIDFQGRTGFIKLAYRYGVPIVPVVNVGGHEVYFTAFSSRRLAQWTGLERLLRVQTLPLNFGLPWGMWWTGFIPYLPLPSKIVYKVGEPIYFERNPELAEKPEALEAAYRQITGTMQGMMDELASRRRFPVIG